LNLHAERYHSIRQNVDTHQAIRSRHSKQTKYNDYAVKGCEWKESTTQILHGGSASGLENQRAVRHPKVRTSWRDSSISPR
ncbi:hypothetical protein L9F63_021377, partial [Diploptera punctata]